MLLHFVEDRFRLPDALIKFRPLLVIGLDVCLYRGKLKRNEYLTILLQSEDTSVQIIA
jgi:hypothetical protein